jgi:hypothetical protein
MPRRSPGHDPGVELSCLGSPEAIITIKVDSSKALVEAFTTAEANPGELYYIFISPSGSMPLESPSPTNPRKPLH